jgi:phosphatidylserine/phosphatidylglycerophosphate/cardiolipin synthase-like enzyme
MWRAFLPDIGEPLFTWILLATGFTGALTLVFLWRLVCRSWGAIPSVAVCFSPKGGCTEAVVRELKQARREVLVLAYSFTSKPIVEALVEAKKRGADVQIVLDRSNEKEEYSELPVLVAQGLTPHIDAHHAIAHNKVMIVDRRTVITGSFNFTHQAEVENAENLLVLKGHPELVARYRQDFLTHKAHSQAPGTAHPMPHAHAKAA